MNDKLKDPAQVAAWIQDHMALAAEMGGGLDDDGLPRNPERYGPAVDALYNAARKVDLNRPPEDQRAFTRRHIYEAIKDAKSVKRTGEAYPDETKLPPPNTEFGRRLQEAIQAPEPRSEARTNPWHGQPAHWEDDPVTGVPRWELGVPDLPDLPVEDEYDRKRGRWRRIVTIPTLWEWWGRREQKEGPGSQSPHLAEAKRMRAEGKSPRAIAKALGISHTRVVQLLDPSKKTR
jgi:hypothetical protein